MAECAQLESPRATQKDFQQLRERDMAWAKRQREIREAKAKKESEQERRASGKVDKKLAREPRDPTRLYRPTMSTLYKFELGDDNDSPSGDGRSNSSGIGDAKSVRLGRQTTTANTPRAGRLATPSWRSKVK